MATAQAPHRKAAYVARVLAELSSAAVSREVGIRVKQVLDDELLLAVWCFVHPAMVDEVSGWAAQNLDAHPTGLEVRPRKQRARH